MTNHSIVMLTRLQASTNLIVCTKFSGFVIIRKNFKYWYLQKNSHLKVRNRKRRGMGRIKEEEGAKEGAMGMSGRGWRREKWEGVREGVMGMSVGKEEQEWEWDGEWV